MSTAFYILFIGRMVLVIPVSNAQLAKLVSPTTFERALSISRPPSPGDDQPARCLLFLSAACYRQQTFPLRFEMAQRVSVALIRLAQDITETLGIPNRPFHEYGDRQLDT